MKYSFRITTSDKIAVKDITFKDALEKSVTKAEDGKNIIQFEAEQKFTTAKVADEFGKLVETDNLSLLITEAKKVAKGKLEYHVCNHDSEINIPCGAWCSAEVKPIEKEVIARG